jgi:hypothetical protein
MYVQSMYMKYITNLILDLAHPRFRKTDVNSLVKLVKGNSIYTQRGLTVGLLQPWKSWKSRFTGYLFGQTSLYTWMYQKWGRL